jgi:demethylmenaquinone methyltransferase/2-methoxy-6-polyprenyl-1,4-benzoquinol methylase
MAHGPLAAGEDRRAAVRTMFDRVAQRYELVNGVLTFGLDAGWRRRAIAALGLPRGSVVLDVACGTGELCRGLAVSGLRAIGVDVSEGMLDAAHGEVRVVQGDGLALPVATCSVDGVTCGFAVRNVTEPAALFAEIGRVVRPGGRLAVLEVAEPERQPARALHHLYFHRVVPIVGGLLSDREAYRYLPESTSFLPAPEELASMVAEAGFVDYRRCLAGMGAAQLLTATRR